MPVRAVRRRGLHRHAVLAYPQRVAGAVHGRDGRAEVRQRVAEQPNAASLGVLYVVYSYSALAAGRQPKAISVVSGTRLILPAL